MFHHRGTRSVLGILVAVSTVFAYQHDHRREGAQESVEHVLWVDPGDPALFDFQYGVAGSDHQPEPPFRFLNEDLSRTTPKINVIDNRGVAWNVKWGSEAPSSNFCTRFVNACGYIVGSEYFVASGRIEGVRELTRAKEFISDDGAFTDARFQRRGDSPKYLKGNNWTLDENPFLHTPELQGLKILMLLLSNWDTRESNFGIFEDVQDGRKRFLYSQTDWGASLGRYGSRFRPSKWKCKEFAEQSRDFVKGVKHDRIKWGFSDRGDIRVSDVRWLLQYLTKITDTQIRLGLSASGATSQEIDCYTQGLRLRIEQLQRAAE